MLWANRYLDLDFFFFPFMYPLLLGPPSARLDLPSSREGGSHIDYAVHSVSISVDMPSSFFCLFLRVHHKLDDGADSREPKSVRLPPASHTCRSAVMLSWPSGTDWIQRIGFWLFCDPCQGPIGSCSVLEQLDSELLGPSTSRPVQAKHHAPLWRSPIVM